MVAGDLGLTMKPDVMLTVSLPSATRGASPVQAREIAFAGPDTAALAEEAARFWTKGYCRFALAGEPEAVSQIASALHALRTDAVESGGQPGSEGIPGTVHVYAGIDGDALGGALLNHVDSKAAAVIAPIGERHGSKTPLFLISIPKAGTHLLYELARALGYADGVVCPDDPRGGTWYCIEYSNSHTTARDFLVDTTRRSPFGNKHHPFFRSPALFVYRNPLDILVSEANWYHDPCNSPLAGYLSALELPARLLRLADDPWLLGTIRDRVGGFIPWLDFPNVIPLSFEELVGARGGGSDQAQLDLIWSIQLKLQVGGRPEEIARRVFNPNSPTFTEGRIGGWARHCTQELQERLKHLPPDYLEAFGFASAALGVAPPISTRAAEFRRRPLELPKIDFSDTQIAVESEFLEHNIVRYRDRFFAVPHTIGPINLVGDAGRAFSGVKSAPTFDAARVQVLRRRVFLGPLWNLWKSIYTRLRHRS